MKKFIIGCAMLAISAMGFAATETFQVTMNILAALTITEVQPLVFEDVEFGTGTTLTTAPTDASNSARFTLSGEASTNILVSVADIDMTDGSDTIPVNNWVITDETSSAITALDGTGARTVWVGADATVEATDAVGAYAGTATLTAVYN